MALAKSRIEYSCVSHKSKVLQCFKDLILLSYIVIKMIIHIHVSIIRCVAWYNLHNNY